VLLGAILRFNQLNNLPALNADEAAIGYNVYSLLETGRDEHGNPWPIHFQSFNDYKPGLYFYLTLPFVKVLGLTELAVRLPGATLGVLSIFVVWLLVKNLFPDKKYLAELSALFLAISPWHIHFSRGGWEVNAATFFITLGVLGLTKSAQSSKWFLVTLLSWVAAMYTYHAARVVIPLLALSLSVYYDSILKNKKRLATILLVGTILLIPLARDMVGEAGVSRASGVGLLADPGPVNKTNVQRGEHLSSVGLAAEALHNKVVNYALAFAQNYTEHFSGDFLFISGDDIERNKIPEFGVMYLSDMVFILIGILAILKGPKGWYPVLMWLLVAPIAAALTFQSPHALRAHNMVIPLTIISAFGLWNLVLWSNKYTKTKLSRFAFCVLLFTPVVWDFSRYLHQYYIHLNKTYDYSSQYGVKKLVEYTKTQSRYSNYLITTRYDQPYIIFLFYLKHPPEKFQKEHTLTARDRFGFSTVEKFSNYSFKEITNWNATRTSNPNTLIAGAPEEIPDGANVINTIYFPSGKIAFKVVAN